MKKEVVVVVAATTAAMVVGETMLVRRWKSEEGRLRHAQPIPGKFSGGPRRFGTSPMTWHLKCMTLVKILGRLANKRSFIRSKEVYTHIIVYFENYLHSSVWEMLGSELSDDVIIEHSMGGSGTGCIFLAAAQTQYIAQP